MKYSWSNMVSLLSFMEVPEVSFVETESKDFLTTMMCGSTAIPELPSKMNISRIDDYVFYNCTNLALTSLPEGLTSIGDHAFSNCPNLALTSLPAGLTSIDREAFRECKGLTTMTFKGTPTSIHRFAFSYCTNLTTINVPWAEGEVANAPWGATNATINYNYVEE